MKAVIVLLLAAVALPAGAGILENRAQLNILCDMYAGAAGIAASERDKGIAYGDALAGMQNSIAIASRQSHQSRDDKAFMAQYLARSVAFAYMTPVGTTPDEVKARAGTACRNQFGL